MPPPKTLHGIYNHIRMIKGIMEHRQIHNRPEGQMDFKWVYLASYTKSITRYEEIIRGLSKLINVTVLRNPYNLHDGIYVVGREHLVYDFRSYLLAIIEKVEGRTRMVTHNKFNRNVHLSEIRADFRIKCCGLYIRTFKEINHRYRKTKEIWISDRIMRQDLIDQVPLLSSKKIYHAR